MAKFQLILKHSRVIEGGVTAPRGFKAAGIHSGMRRNKTKRDLAMLCCDVRCAAAGAYTQNLVKGATIAVTRRNLADGYAQGLICNSGNANTCNADGEQKAEQMCRIAARVMNIAPEDVIVASTGVIGQVLNIAPIENSAEELASQLRYDGGSDAADAILTTDRYRKQIAFECDLCGTKVRFGAMAKGSGMVHPNMATILCFVTTDAAISPEMLRKALGSVIPDTFNMVSVDGDTSTNDTVAVMASGLAGNPIIEGEGREFDRFTEALKAICVTICRELARDGEGSTRLLICDVNGARDDENARIIAKSVICSSLVKAAMFGSDANWGRVLCAIGYSGATCDITKVEVAFVSERGRIIVCQNGAGVTFDEDRAKDILLADEVIIDIICGDGDGKAEAYGCDLTYDYVRISGDYRAEHLKDCLTR
ncbi:MAG: bifunctional glutamate N-acetyltransferase/amino-acid acetyltransferase ArgJ [Acutalibacteraceae bacterium]